MKVLGIGEAILDRVTLLDEYPQEGTKMTPRKIETSLGGSAVNALVMLSNLGVECTLIAGLADDDNGLLIRKKLKNSNIKLIPKTQKYSRVHTVLVSAANGSRTVIKDNVKSAQIQNISADFINSHDLVLFDRHVVEPFKEVMLKKNDSTKTLIDTSIEVSQKTLHMFEHADFPIIPDEFLLKLKKDKSISETLESIYNLTNKQFIVTLGGDGVMVFDGKIISHISPKIINVVDTLGAGDIFRGAFAYGVLRGWDIFDAVEFGNLSAALQCTKLGGVTAVPTKEEIYAFQKVAQVKKVDLRYLNLEIESTNEKGINILREIKNSNNNFVELSQ